MVSFTTTIPRGERNSVAIVTTAEELKSLEDTNSYITLSPTVGLTVDVHNNLSDIEIASVELYHPDSEQLKETAPGSGTYLFRSGILPGQGFGVIWKKRQENLQEEIESSGDT